jgi:hypothetical protein
VLSELCRDFSLYSAENGQKNFVETMDILRGFEFLAIHYVKVKHFSLRMHKAEFYVDLKNFSSVT